MSFLDELNVALLSLLVKPISVSLFSIAEPSTMKKNMTPMKILIQESNFFIFSLLEFLEDDTKMPRNISDRYC